MGLPLPVKMLASVANKIIERSLSDEEQFGFKPVSDKWVNRFMAKHNILKVKSKPIELARKEAHDPECMRLWFGEYRAALDEYEVVPVNIWNFDETGFRIGVGGSEWIVTFDTRRRAWSPSDTNRQHVTAIEAVSAVRIHIDAMFIAAGKVLQERWFQNLRDYGAIAVNESGYLDDEIALE